MTQIIRPAWVLNPDPSRRCSQAARTATLPIAPPGQVTFLRL